MIQCLGAGMIQETGHGFATVKLSDGQVEFTGHFSALPCMLGRSLHSCIFEIFHKKFFFFFEKRQTKNSTLAYTGKRAGMRKTLRNSTKD